MDSEHGQLISANVPFAPEMYDEHHWCHPLDAPQWVGAADAGHMRPDDPVLGIEAAGQAWALPWWIMKNHHVANLTLNGQPVLVTLCEACSSGTAFTPIVDSRRLHFALAGVLNGTHYIADRETGSRWHSFGGLAFAGALEGATLDQLPLQQSTWQEWLDFYPDSSVLFGVSSMREGHGSGFSPGSPQWDGFDAHLLSPLDPRLPHNILVLGVKSNGSARAYTLERLTQEAGVVNDQLGNTPIVVLHRPGTWAALAFDACLDGRQFTFRRARDGSIADNATNSLWREDGVAYAGEMAGCKLRYLPSHVEEWYVWAAYHPETELFGDDNSQKTEGNAPVQEAIFPILAEHIQTKLLPAGSGVVLTPETPLLQSGLIDSLTLFRFLTFIQRRFQIKIRPKEVVAENFATLAATERLISAKQQATEGQP